VQGKPFQFLLKWFFAFEGFLNKNALVFRELYLNFEEYELKIIKELLEKENTKESEFLWTRTGNYNFAYIGL